MVAAQYGISLLVQYLNLFHWLCESEHVVTHQRYAGADSGRIILLQIRFRSVVSRVFSCSPTLQLTTPDAAEIHIKFSIVVFKDGRVNAIASLDGFGVRLERT